MVNTEWLEDLFGPYDFYYVDPLLLKSSSEKASKRNAIGWERLFGPIGKKEKSKWYSEDVPYLQDYLRKLKRILGTEGSKLGTADFFEDGLHRDLLSDRGKQKKFVDAFGSVLEKSGRISSKRRFSSVEKLCRSTDELRGMPNQLTPDCLVFVDGVINRVDSQNQPDLYQSVQVLPRSEDREPRLVRFLLSDHAWPLHWMGAPGIGLMVSRKALMKTYPTVENDSDTVGLDGWYPFARVLGYWQTERGGRPFIDVLAILVKSFPTLDAIFQATSDGAQRKLTQMLAIARDAVQKAMKLAQEQSYDAANDSYLLYPLLLYSLCFNLNGINEEQLSTRAPAVHNLVLQYRSNLDEFADFLEKHEMESLLPMLLNTSRRSQIKLLIS